VFPAPVPAGPAVVAVVVCLPARSAVRHAPVALAVRPAAAAHVVAALADLVVRALASAGAAVVAIAAGIAAGAAVRDAGVPLPVVAGSAADAMPVIADLVLAAAIAAGPAVVAIVVGISAAVRDALVALAMFVG